MSNSSSSSSGGIGFFGLLQILFIGLKLTNFIAWPWWQVLLPTIISLSILFICLALVAFLLVLKDKEYKFKSKNVTFDVK
ncbi:hypothetical protein EBT25_01215 [bacterium]|jgi:hypothetical protein|nr:hypothetical protein [bacterium]